MRRYKSIGYFVLDFELKKNQNLKYYDYAVDMV